MSIRHTIAACFALALAAGNGCQGSGDAISPTQISSESSAQVAGLQGNQSTGILRAFREPPTVEQMRERYAGPSSQFVVIDGVQMHYRDSKADAPTVMLLPGHMGSLHMYDGWLPFLQEEFRTIGLDWPPYGLSIPDPSGVYSSPRAAELVVGFMETMQIEKSTLVGTSNGATVAAHVAALRPDLVELLALSTFPLGRPPEREISPELLDEASRHMSNDTYRPESLYRAILEDIFYDPANVTPELVRLYTDMNNHPGGYQAQAEYIQSNIAMYAQAGWPDIYQKVTAPTLIQWGDGGVVVPPELAQSAVDALPNAPVVLLRYPEAGHMPMLEQPEKTARDLIAFIQGEFEIRRKPTAR